MSSNKTKITQQEINDIYEITKDEPFPKVKEVIVKEEEESESFLTEEEQDIDDRLFEDNIVPEEEKEKSNA